MEVGEKQFFLRLFFFGFLCAHWLGVVKQSAAQTPFEQRVRSYVDQLQIKPEAKLSLMVRQLDRGKSVFIERDANVALIPASAAKLVVSTAVLRKLGAEYRFPTEIFVDSLPNERDVSLNKSGGLTPDKGPWSAGNLYIRGYGDPSLIDQRLWELVRQIRQRGVSEVANVVLDDSLFIKPPTATGEFSYQTALSALSINHNSYAVHVTPQGIGLKPHVELTDGAPYSLTTRALTQRAAGEISIGQNPSSLGFNATTFFRKNNLGLVVGKTEVDITVQGAVSNQELTQTFYRSVPYPPSYFAGILKSLLAAHGVRVSGDFAVGATPLGAKRLFQFESFPLQDIVNDLNRYSNNFIAGQLLFALGQDPAGYFRQELGFAELTRVLTDLGFAKEEFTLVDASGLDRRNRLSANQLATLLASVAEDFSVYPYLLSSLSRFGASGTLEKRTVLSVQAQQEALRSELPGLQRRAAGVWAKTGTLEGVSSLAGYVELESGQRAAFAILSNGLSKDEAAEIEDTFVAALIGVKTLPGAVSNTPRLN